MEQEPIRAAIIGCGRQQADGGYRGISPNHAKAYAANGATIVALCDINRDNAELFKQRLAPDAAIFADYVEMAREAEPQVVSVCTWPHLHAEMVAGLAGAGVPAIHCEKPMALTLADARRMVEACAKSGTRLTVNHQRRFSPGVRAMKELVNDGRIGTVRRVEGRCDNLYDWGTHWFDLLRHLTGDAAAEWVQAAVHDDGERAVFGAANDLQSVVHVRLGGGASGVIFAGRDKDWPFPPEMPALSVVGSEGVAEMPKHDGGGVRWRRDDAAGWNDAELPEADVWQDAVADVLAGVRDPSHRSLISGDSALQTTELVFAAYHSARLRGAKVDLPLNDEAAADNALMWMRDHPPEWPA